MANEPLVIKFKRLVAHAQEELVPATSGSAGLDLVATDLYHNRDFDFIEYGTGLSVEIPEGYVGLLFPRSSISKTPHILANSVGVIDSDYRGEIKLRFKTKEDREDFEYGIGDKVGQLIIMPYPKVKFEEAELSDSSRGAKGFGSTGK